MARLALPATQIRSEYDAIVIGSGYGGGVAASRLARMGLSVCVIERGQELLPGEFPKTAFECAKQFQTRGVGIDAGAADGLFDLRRGRGMNVLSGCGVGGTSLINAGVCLQPSMRVFEDDVWPEEMRHSYQLWTGFARAQRMLNPQTLPSHLNPAKLKSLEKIARKAGRSVDRAPTHIAFEDGKTCTGVAQTACIQCGDCMSGCNFGAKTTVHSTYLTDAVKHGAEIYAGYAARRVERQPDGRWLVILARSDGNGDDEVKRIVVAASTVVLSAGVLGTTELLMRSRERGLALSSQLGKRVSANGDLIAFGYDFDHQVNGVGAKKLSRKGEAKVGPAVTGYVDLRRGRAGADEFLVVEAAVPSAMASLFNVMMKVSAQPGFDFDKGFADGIAEGGRHLRSLIGGAYQGTMRNTQAFLAVGIDSASGTIAFDNDSAFIDWPEASGETVYALIRDTLRRYVEKSGGTFVDNPASSRLLGGDMMTVHPLGGCAIAPDAATGVVDHRGRVFNPASDGEDAVHEGLYVCDGSVVPRSLGVHPLMTITALAERSMMLYARDHGLQLPVKATGKPATTAAVETETAL